MLIPKIVAQVDAQLERLEAARAEIVALLGASETTEPARPMKPMKASNLATAGTAAPDVAAIESTDDSSAHPVTGRVAARSQRESRGSRRRRETEPSALGKSFPAGPVVVSQAAVRQRVDARLVAVAAPAEEKPESGFDALLREAAARSRFVVS